jgi:hypothetical protein
MESFVELVRDLMIFIVAMFALMIVLIILIARLPDSNPLKRLLSHLCYRVGATLGASLIAIPVEPVPGLDVAYDIGVPLILLYYWFTFFREAYRAVKRPPA